LLWTVLAHSLSELKKFCAKNHMVATLMFAEIQNIGGQDLLAHILMELGMEKKVVQTVRQASSTHISILT